jgi:hypothetical protein
MFHYVGVNCPRPKADTWCLCLFISLSKITLSDGHTAYRAQQETERLIADPAPGIQAVPHEDNLRYFDVMINGPGQSPFEGELPRCLSRSAMQSVLDGEGKLMCWMVGMVVQVVASSSSSSCQKITQWHLPKSAF